jgi:hypothetical protein
MRHGLSLTLILFCFGAMFLICYAPALLLDRQFAYRDAGNYYYPLNKRVQAEWSAGRWPLWEPEENAGMPLLGNPTAAVLYPGKLVFAVLPYAWGARIYIVAHSALAFVSMYALMRSWNTSLYGSALSALAYAFAAPILFQTTNIIYLVGAAWLPLGVRAVDRWVRLGRRWGLCELAIVLSMQVLGGDIQSGYLLGVASIGYASCLAWNRARSAGEITDRATPRRSRRRLSLVLMAIVPLLWCLVTLALAGWLPRLREPGTPPPPLRWMVWMPLSVNVVWGLVALGVLIQWWRCSGRSPLAVMWLGLGGSAALAVALTAAQLFPVIEFTQLTGRSNPGPHEVYRFTLDPCQLVELVWPNILGASFGGNDHWRDIVETPGIRLGGWVPSLYLGGLTVALALGSLTLRRGPPWRVWLTVLAGLSLLGSLGQCTSPIWLARAVSRTPNSATLRTWLPDLGPIDSVDSTTIRKDGYLHDCDGSFYWCLSTVLPGFRQFRYPAKLLTVTALAMAALTGLGWDDLCTGRARGAAKVFFVLILLTTATLTVVTFRREPILESFRVLKSPSWLGPFQALAGYGAIIHGLGHSLMVLAVGFILTGLARRSPRLAGSAALILMTLDLGAANARYVLTVPQSSFETKPEVLRVIEDAERLDPSPGPFRTHRMWQWYPSSWAENPSNNRVVEALSWDRDTLYPKSGIDLGVEYTHTPGVGQLADYERFFASFRSRVRDNEAARYLDVGVGEEVLYYPRRAYDMWNTRYIIVAFDANDWRDPSRGSASFLFHSRQVYPDPDRFTGPNGAEQAKGWAEARDFKVIRNLVEYPRSWIVHAARATKTAMNASSDAHSETLREMLYAADPFWNNGMERVYDPHNVAWVSRTDLNKIRRDLSGLATGPSETVTVTYPNPQQAVLEVNLDSPGLVILADVYYPGWVLAIDGEPAPIHRVNGLMRGAAVSSGRHRLVYSYAPLSFRLGRVISIGGLAAFAILVLACVRWPVSCTLGRNRSR